MGDWRKIRKLTTAYSLALAEIRLTLAHVLWNFEIELNDETDPDWIKQKAWMTWQKKPLIVNLKARTV